MNTLAGKKTYIVAGVAGVGVAAGALGWLDSNQVDLLLKLCVPAFAATFRAALSNGGGK